MNKILVTIVIVLVLAGLAYAYWDNPVRTNDQIACTMEALVCPDGSGVGRSGPECKFDPCPNQEHFIGVLKQRETGFVLVLKADPDNNLPDVYSLPLELRVSNALRDLVDQEVRARGDFQEGSTLVVDNLEAVQKDN